jgi:glyceraldehyde 3-phosphate dehydrogenase
MAVKVAINGFGRIGRLVLRAIIESNRTDVECVAINDLGSVEANAHLLRYDSVHGRFPGEIGVEGNALVIKANGRSYAPITRASMSPWSARASSPRRRRPRRCLLPARGR